MTKILFYIVFALSLVLAAALGWVMIETNLISVQLVLIAVAVLALIPLLMFLLQKEKKDQNRKKGFRIAAIVILLFLSIVEGAVCFYIQKYSGSLLRFSTISSVFGILLIILIFVHNHNSVFCMKKHH